ncbi:MAG: hypothetical protein KJP08_01175 [Gammaproteobacteria bacterium]|nr:hypothetical protein [Gammaproteobacteria bacterium]MBT8093395.1 hypothetical protein [Gammaproteobacteria bacterium]
MNSIGIASAPARQFRGEGTYRVIEQLAFAVIGAGGGGRAGATFDLVDEFAGPGGARDVQPAHPLPGSEQHRSGGLPRPALNFLRFAFARLDVGERFLLCAEDPCDG